MFERDDIIQRVKAFLPYFFVGIAMGGALTFWAFIAHVSQTVEATGDYIREEVNIMKEMMGAQKPDEGATITSIGDATLEELISEIEERTAEPTMETICLKLESYAKSLEDTVKYGVVTLSEKEMKVLREYVNNNFEKATGRFINYKILGTDEVISGLGVSSYENPDFYLDYKFILDTTRSLIFIGPEFRKPVVISNSIDHPDKNITPYKIVSGQLEDGYLDAERFDMIKTHGWSYTYYRDEESIILEQWKFGRKINNWKCSAWKSDNVWYGAPKALYWKEDEDEYSFIAENHLLLARNGKITVLAEGMDYKSDVIQIQSNDDLFFYVKDKELHAVDKNTLEDNIVTEEYPDIYEQIR